MPRPAASRRLAILACVLLAAPAAGSEDAASEVLAHYRGGTVTVGEYRGWLAYRELAEAPGVRRGQVRLIALTESLAAAAEARGAAREPELARVLEAARNGPLIEALRRHRQALVEVTDEEIEALYRKHPDAFSRPRKVALSNLYKKLPADPEAAAAVRAEMESLRRRLLDGADFAELARRESQSHTRYQKGYIGFVEAGQLAAAVDAVAMRLAPGEISQVLETGGGLSILRCERVAPARTPSAEEARRKLRQNLARQRLREDWQAFEDELWRSGSPAAGKGRAGGSRELPAAQRQRRLEALLAREAERLGLVDSARLAPRLHWRRLEIMARAEIAERAERALAPATEDEVRGHFEAHPGRFQYPAEWRLAAIRLAPEPGAPENEDLRRRYRLAEELLAGLEAGRITFADAAREHSDHPSSAAGGDLGWLPRVRIGALGAGAFQAVRELEPGQLSGVLRLEPDLWILRLSERRRPRPMRFEEARVAAAAELAEQRAGELRRQIRRQALRDLEIRWHFTTRE